MTDENDSSKRTRDERLRDTLQGLRELDSWEFYAMVLGELNTRLLEGTASEPVPGIYDAAIAALDAVLDAEPFEPSGARARLVAKLAACARGVPQKVDGSANIRHSDEAREASDIVEKCLERSCSQETKVALIASKLEIRFQKKVPPATIRAILRDRPTVLGRATDVAMLLGIYSDKDRDGIQRAVSSALAQKQKPD